MPIDPQQFARMLGAEIVGEVPDVGGGPFGMARLAHIMHERLTPSRGERPGRPTNPDWHIRPKVPMSEATARKLAEIAEAMSTRGRKVSPMQVAAQLLEDAVGRVKDETLPASGENGRGRADSASSAEAQTGPAGKIRVGGKVATVEPSRKPTLRDHQGKPAGRKKKA